MVSYFKFNDNFKIYVTKCENKNIKVRVSRGKTRIYRVGGGFLFLKKKNYFIHWADSNKYKNTSIHIISVYMCLCVFI
jgi:hypothetical protein